MRIRNGLAVFALTTAVALMPMPAAAQTQQQVDQCNSKDGATRDLVVSGCTALIQSNRFTGKILASIFFQRGNAYLHQDNDSAINDYNQSIRLDPNFAGAYFNRAAAYEFKHVYPQAVADLAAYTRLVPTNPDGWTELCWVRGRAGQLEQAIKDCNEALRLKPEFASAFDARGFVHLKAGAFDKAIADYDIAIKSLPKFVEALYGRGLAKRKKGDNAGADADIAAAKALLPTIADDFAHYGLK